MEDNSGKQILLSVISIAILVEYQSWYSFPSLSISNLEQLTIKLPLEH